MIFSTGSFCHVLPIITDNKKLFRTITIPIPDNMTWDETDKKKKIGTGTIEIGRSRVAAIPSH